MPFYNGTMWSDNNSPRWGDPDVIWGVIHTQEGNGSARSLAAYCQEGRSQVSYHATVDDKELIGIVPLNRGCWALLNGNPRSVNICFAGSSVRWSRAEWLKHRSAIRKAARYLYECSVELGYSLRFIGDDGVSRMASGVIEHGNYSRGAHDGNHSDCGPNFPWDVLKAELDALSNGAPAPVTGDDDDMSAEQYEQLRKDIGYIRDQIRQDIAAVPNTLLDTKISAADRNADGTAHQTTARAVLGWSDTHIQRNQDAINGLEKSISEVPGKTWRIGVTVANPDDPDGPPQVTTMGEAMSRSAGYLGVGRALLKAMRLIIGGAAK